MASVAQAGFDSTKAYKSWEVDGRFHGDGREVALLQYMYSHPALERLRGNPEKVLEAIDAFARTHTGLINIGEAKGRIVCDVIAHHKPLTILELGGYIGYSAIMFGHALKQAGGERYLSVEKDPLFAAVAASLVDLAGLRDRVRIVVGTGAAGIQRLYDEGAFGGSPGSGRSALPIGMAFFDHHKPSYTADLKRCERLGLIGRGTVLVADNMVLPGNPPYLAWVRASVAEKREMEAAAAAQEGEKGNPNLLYRSRFVPSYEPSGQEDALEISECLGEAA
ncbi:hypothetical protein VTK26DRAFT_4735 [Humicola hyalothermophila]